MTVTTKARSGRTLLGKARILIVMGLVMGSVTLLGGQTAGATGETLTVVLSQKDGAAPFNADSVAGHDANDSNGIVRTNDNLTYNVELRVDQAPSTNTTFTLQLPKGVELSQVPAYCTGAGSSLTPASLGAPVIPVTATSWTSLAQQTLVCNVGARTANSTFTYPVVAKVRPEVPNGTPLHVDTVSATTTDVTIPATSNPVDAVVSARAQFDLSKNAMAATENTGYINGGAGISPCPTASEPNRRCFPYGISMLISAPPGGKGLTPMGATVSFQDDLSPAGIYPAGVTSDPDWVAAGGGALAKYGAVLRDCERMEWAQPGAKVGLASQYTPPGTLDGSNSVRDSGTTTCSQPGGPGTPVDVTVSNLDSTAYTYPTGTTPGGGLAIPADKAYVYSMSLWFLIPTDAVVDLGTPNASNTQWTLKWDNKYIGFDPTGIDGASNMPGANLAFNDHRGSTSVIGASGSFDKFFTGVPGALGNTPPTAFNPGFAVWEGPAGSTGTQTGEGQIFPGQVTTSTLIFRNSSTAQVSRSFLACDAWDPSVLRLTSRVQPGGADIPGRPAANSLQVMASGGSPAWLSGYADPNIRFDPAAYPGLVSMLGLTFEYGNGTGGSGAASRCDDASSPAGWHADPNDPSFGNDPALAAQGVYTGVSRVRAHMVMPYAPGSGSFVTLNIGLQATPGLAAGTILPNWANAKAVVGDASQTELLDPAVPWGTNDYNPATNAGSSGDRLRTSPGVARIRKEVKDPGTGTFGTSTPQFTGGQTAEFRLQPTLTSGINGDVRIPLVVEDCLPVGELFDPASSSPAASVVQAGSPAGAGITCATGETYVKWDLGAVQVNATIAPITYSAKVARAATAGTKVNTVLVTAEGDVSAVAQRTAQASIQVVQPAGIVVDKYALTESPWDRWRLLTLETRMESCRRRSVRGSRPRAGTAPRRRPRPCGWCASCERSSGLRMGRSSGSPSRSVVGPSRFVRGFARPTSTRVSSRA